MTQSPKDAILEQQKPIHHMVYPIVFAVGFGHFINDLIQSCLPAIYPMLKTDYGLSFTQIGLITLIYQITASVLQPCVGLYTDKYPKPYLLPLGMLVTVLGICVLALSHSFYMLLVSAALIGVGSSAFHPDASRVARMASGGKLGTAQSIFQVGGNSGSAVGPLLAAALIIPNGQAASAWLIVFAFIGIAVLYRVSRWTVKHSQTQLKKMGQAKSGLQGATLKRAIGIIAILMLAKFTYTVSLSNYYTFYLIEKFNFSVQDAQFYLFAFLGSAALGTFLGGPIGDRIGRNAVIWFSFIGMAPFALLLPYADAFWTCILAMLAGLIMSSAFSTMVVYAQEALPGRVGLVAGLMFGLMFGISGIAGAGLGYIADHQGIMWVFTLCSYLPLLGVLTFFLPNNQTKAIDA